MQKKFIELETQLNNKFINRKDEIRGLLITLLANGNLVLLGGAGTAKTDLVQTLARCINAECFETILTKTSSPEELWGAYSIKELEQGNYVRNTKHSLAETEIGFVDEVFKCNSAVLNGLLGIMAQRTFRNGSSAPALTPLKLLVGASNELPDGGADGELSALWDRFEMRFIVQYIKDERSFSQLMNMNSSLEPTIKIDIQEVLKAQTEIQKILFAPLEKNIILLWKELRKEGYSISDRKWRNSIRYMQANAWLEGRTELCEDDLEVLSNMFWNAPEQIKPLKKIIGKYINPSFLKAQEQYDSCCEILAELDNFTDDDTENKNKYGCTLSAKATEVHGKLSRAKKFMGTLVSEMKEQGKNTRKLEDILSEIDGMVVQVVTKYLIR